MEKNYHVNVLLSEAGLCVNSRTKMRSRGDKTAGIIDSLIEVMKSLNDWLIG